MSKFPDSYRKVCWEMERWWYSVGPKGLDEREELWRVLVCTDVFVCEANACLA
jgi:hypothetical protein